jgi:hypothetical protein
MNNKPKQINPAFETILDYCLEYQKKIDNRLTSMLSIDKVTGIMLSQLFSIDIICLLNELELNNKQIDILKKHITLLNQ